MRQSPTIKEIRLNEINTCPYNTLVKLGRLKYIRSDLPVESRVTDCLTYIKCLCVCLCVSSSPSGVGVRSLMLPGGVDVTHGKVLHDLRHVLVAEEHFPAGFVCKRRRRWMKRSLADEQK